jgi:hypothetical protein
MRRSRHVVPDTKPDLDIYPTGRCLATLQLFDRYRILPLNWMHALVGGGSYVGYRNLCTRMTLAKLLERRTLNGRRNNNETQTYSRSKAGDKYLHERGYEALPHDSHHDAHQALVDIAEAQIELGARAADVEYHPWVDIRDHPKTPRLPDRPFRFDVNDTYQIPDGRPFYLKNARGSMLFLREIDRNTEAPDTIRIKLRNYRQLQDRIQSRYGFRHMMLLFVTTNETRKENILRLLGEEFVSGCKWILVATMTDHVKECLTTTPVATHLFTEPYLRAGHRPFSLLSLADV